MKTFYTAPDVFGDRKTIRETRAFIPTIYSVRADVNVSSLVAEVPDAIAEILDKIQPANRFFLKRPLNVKHSVGQLMSMMKTMPGSVIDFTEENTSPRQWQWSSRWAADPKGLVSNIGELRINVPSEEQYVPHGTYFTDIDPLLEAMEKTWRQVDSWIGSLPIPRRRYTR